MIPRLAGFVAADWNKNQIVQARRKMSFTYRNRSAPISPLFWSLNCFSIPQTLPSHSQLLFCRFHNSCRISATQTLDHISYVQSTIVEYHADRTKKQRKLSAAQASLTEPRRNWHKPQWWRPLKFHRLKRKCTTILARLWFCFRIFLWWKAGPSAALHHLWFQKWILPSTNDRHVLRNTPNSKTSNAGSRVEIAKFSFHTFPWLFQTRWSPVDRQHKSESRSKKHLQKSKVHFWDAYSRT